MVKPRPQWLRLVSANWKTIATFIIPLVLLPLPLLDDTAKSNCAYMVAVMALFWMLDLLPMAVVSLIPVALCPLMGIMSTDNISMQYMKGSIMLFMGGT